MNRILVVGGDGLIGRALVEELSAAGHAVTATTRREPRDGTIPLDLDADPPAGLADGFDRMIIAAAIPDRAACTREPALARRVNALAPARLAQPVLARGDHVLHLSTHIVLGGASPCLAADAPYAPCDPYSEQKAEAERRLLALPGAAEGLAILRLTKVLDASTGVVARWAAAAQAGQPVVAYGDLITAPVTVAHVTASARRIVESRATGIFHVSGWPEIAYAGLARGLAERLGWDPGLVRAVEGRRTDPVAAANPPHASLACDDPMSPEVVIEALAADLA